MSDDTPSLLNNVITIDDERIKSHLDRVVRGTVEETLNALLDAEAATWYGCPKVAAAQAQVGRTTRYGPPVRPFPEVAVTGRTVPGRWYVVRYGTLGR